MSKLLAPMHDAHIKIKAEVDGAEAVFENTSSKTELALKKWAEQTKRTTNEAIGLFRRDYWLKDVKEVLLENKGVIAANGRIQYGMTSDDVGYIAFVSMGGFANGELETFKDELPLLDAVMDDAVSLFTESKAKAVIVDVSLNIGGYDFVGLSIAGRFAENKVKAFDRRAGDDPNAKDFPLFVEPSHGKRFTGPVYLLTSDQTVSAAEILTLSMRALENVVHVGEKTRGAFSTVLHKPLPNGWMLSLSNEIYTDPAGIVWEGKGIEPNFVIPVFDGNNPNHGHTEAVRSVIQRIKKR